jgi:DNA-binding NtrC family response regulator
MAWGSKASNLLEAGASTREPTGDLMKILLVDCDAAVLQYLERLFRDEGGEITSLLYEDKTSATRITDVARAQQFDLAFINILIPSLIGVELSGQIKRVSPNTRIILMSTPISPASLAQLHSYGIAGEFFIEPSVLRELREILESVQREQSNSAHSSLDNAHENGPASSLNWSS